MRDTEGQKKRAARMEQLSKHGKKDLI